MVVEGGATVDCSGGACWVVLGVVAGLLSEPRPIATAIPTSNTATAVPMISTPGTRYHGMTAPFFSARFSERGRGLGSKFSAGRADV